MKFIRLEKLLALKGRFRAENAVTSMQKQSSEIGTDRLSQYEINREIRAARKKKR